MQIRSVLCPVDFSDASRAALRMAARIARQFGAGVRVLFVEDPLLAAATGAPGDLKDELSQFVGGAGGLGLAVPPSVHVVTGQAAEEVVRFAERWRADAIVMGTHGLSGIRKAFFGSTTARVLRTSPIPLWIAPASAGPDLSLDLEGLGSILVLTDFGAAATAAADMAARLADSVGARLVLMHVMPSISAPAAWTPRAAAAMDARSAEAHRQMCAAMAPLRKYGLVETVIVQGNTARCAAEHARTRHAGLIVVGLDREPHGLRPGSTAYGVICSAPVPVLAVPGAL